MKRPTAPFSVRMRPISMSHHLLFLSSSGTTVMAAGLQVLCTSSVLVYDEKINYIFTKKELEIKFKFKIVKFFSFQIILY